MTQLFAATVGDQKRTSGIKLIHACTQIEHLAPNLCWAEN